MMRGKADGFSFLGGNDIQQKGEFKLLGLQEEHPPRPSLGGKSWSPHKVTPEDCARSPYSNAFEKNESDLFFQKQQTDSI